VLPTGSPPDRFRFDPADPTPGIGGPSLAMRNAGRKDQRGREQRSDVLSYTSEPMSRDMTVAGPLTVDLWFRSSLEHTDVSVRLCVVSRKGRSFNVSDGYRRLRPGDVSRGSDGTLHVHVDMWPTAMTFRHGERVRLQVASGAHPLFARNLGTGEPIATASRMQAADQQVFHDPAHPSALELPVSLI
jgi:putative CocE/NonD family hydrolase